MKVAPYVGAWIETTVRIKRLNTGCVAPYVGAWIETSEQAFSPFCRESHPMWVRGLKLGQKNQ